ncbi:MAG: hypothetical protein ABIR59_10680, partial [Gemmatimonadales bacterium]
NNQVALPATALASPLAVRVTDQASVPVSGVTVEFAGAGSASGSSSALTDAQGIARVSWVAGSGPGTGSQEVRAQISGNPAAAAATFTIRALGTLRNVAGDGQAATPGALLSQAPTVQVLDTDQRPIAGVTVNWAVASGLGSAVPSTTTNPAGQASVQWRIGPQGGRDVHALVATVEGLPTTRFTASGAVDNLFLGFVDEGSDEWSLFLNGMPGRQVQVAVEVSARGFPTWQRVVNTPVEWIVTSGGGTVSAGTTVTDGNGRAVTTWTFGSELGEGTQRLRAQMVGTPATSIEAWGTTTGPPSSVAITSGNNQSATVGTQIPFFLNVKVTDASFREIGGVTVTWTVVPVSAASGQLTGQTTTTTEFGQASARLTLGAAPGPVVVTATVTRPDGVNLVARFDITAVP